MGQGYRYYCLDGTGRLHSAEWFEAESDKDAIAQVEATHPDALCENLAGCATGSETVALASSGLVSNLLTVAHAYGSISFVNRHKQPLKACGIVHWPSAVEGRAESSKIVCREQRNGYDGLGSISPVD